MMNLERDRLQPVLLPLLILSAVGAVACLATHPRETLRRELASTVTDEGEHAILAELVRERDEAQDAYQEHCALLDEELSAVNADYDAGPEEIAPLLDRFDAEWAAFRDEMISSALEMRLHTTAEEWRALAPLDIESLLASPGADR